MLDKKLFSHEKDVIEGSRPCWQVSLFLEIMPNGYYSAEELERGANQPQERAPREDTQGAGEDPWIP